MIKKCSTCQQNQRKQQCEPMKASYVPQYPFQMVGSDLLNWNGQDFVLVLITTADIGMLRSFTKQILQQLPRS